jgi:hypothetical protein
MAIKRGRFEEIYRQKTASGEGTFSSLSSASSERAKERSDLRRLFPKSGILGAMLESSFGKAYKYSDKGGKGGKGAGVSANTSSLDDKSLNVIRINTSIMAKNSMVLPGMARDMNIMRQNIVKITKKTVGTAATRADAQFLKSKERESSYESALDKPEKTKKTTSSAPTSKSNQGLFSAIFGGLGAPFGTTGAIIGSIFSGLGTVVGGAFSILKGIASSLGVLGMGGIVLSIVAGSLVSAMFNNLDFNKFGAQFADVGNSIARSISSFFGIKETDNKDGPSVFKQVADYLDNAFNTTGFNDGLAFIIKQWKNLADEISYQIAKLYNNIMINVTASFMAVGDIFVGIGKDIKAIFYKWLDDNTVGLYTVIGAAVGGSLRGPAGATAGAAAGALYGGGQLLANRRRDNAVKDLAEQEQILADMKAKGLTETPKDSRFPYQSIGAFENTIKDTRKIVEANRQEIEDRKGTPFEFPYKSGMKPFDERFKQYKEQAKSLFPEPIRQNSSSEKASTSPTAMSKKDLNSEMAKLIRKRFIEAGFTAEQAEAAVINAFDESRLNPKERSPITNKEDSVGLFQMNRKGGLGSGYSVEQLQDPNFNIDLAIQAAKKSKSFSKAKTMEEAIEAFVRDIERPANIEKEIAERVALANQPLENAVDKNTKATQDLSKQLDDKKEENFTEILSALLQAMASTTTGTNITNVNNTSVTGGGMASPYNDDLLTIFKSRAAQGF